MIRAGTAHERWLVVSVHDVAPGSEAASRMWLELLETRGMRTCLLVVPGPWRGRRLIEDDAFSRWLRDAAAVGHEIVQHGWEHHEVLVAGHPVRRSVGRVAARGCAEFWTIDRADAARRLESGQAALHAAGLRADGFVAPGWLLGRDAMQAVRAAGFRYTTTHRGVLDLLTGRTLQVPVISQRPASGLTAAAAHVTTRWARWAIRHGRALRVAAHPADLADRRTRQAVLGVCESARDAGYRTTTYGGLLGLGRP